MDMATSKYAHMSFEEMDRIVPELIENHGTYQQKLANAEDLVVSKVAGTGDIAKYVPFGAEYAGYMRGKEDPEVGGLRGAVRGSLGGSLGSAVGGTTGALAGLGVSAGIHAASPDSTAWFKRMLVGQRMPDRMDGVLGTMITKGRKHTPDPQNIIEVAQALRAGAPAGGRILRAAIKQNPRAALLAGTAVAAAPTLALLGGSYGQAKGVDWLMPKKAPAEMPPEAMPQEPMKAANLDLNYIPGADAPVLPEYDQLSLVKKYGPAAGSIFGGAAGAVGGSMLTRRMGMPTGVSGAVLGGLLGAGAGRALGRAAIGADARQLHDIQDAINEAHDAQEDRSAYEQLLHDTYQPAINRRDALLRRRYGGSLPGASPVEGKIAAFQEKLRKLANGAEMTDEEAAYHGIGYGHDPHKRQIFRTHEGRETPIASTADLNQRRNWTAGGALLGGALAAVPTAILSGGRMGPSALAGAAGAALGGATGRYMGGNLQDQMTVHRLMSAAQADEPVYKGSLTPEQLAAYGRSQDRTEAQVRAMQLNGVQP